MKNKIILILFLLLLKSNLSYSQITIENSDFTGYKIPQEKIFVHQNTTLLISGEHLYYKVYCINSNTNKISNISKIGYVELIRNDNIVIFKHKIILDNGLGQGDYFINKTIPSGSYKLIAYTENMKNFDNTFFQSDLCIINPFKINQFNILNNNLGNEVDNITLTNEYKLNNNIVIDSLNNSYVDFKVNANTFKNREKVTITFESIKNNLSYGNYSISVRKIDTIQKPKTPTSKSFVLLYPKSSTPKDNINLPELRGELLSGTVTNKNSDLTNPNIKVALSISGKYPIFKIATTNNFGIFYFNIQEEYENKNAIIQIIGDDRDKFKITVNEHASINLKNLNFYDFKITPKLKDYILEKSISNQIENVYASIKPFTLKKIDSTTPFYNSKLKVYFLDDFTRFPTVKETFIEIINEVSVKQKNGNRTLQVKLYDQLFDSDFQPLVLVDGILIQNHNELFNLNAKNIRKISVLDDAYIFDSVIFGGAIFIETITNNYTINYSDNNIVKIELFKPLTIKNYFNQRYDVIKKFNHIPDYRSQLIWVPNFNLNEEVNTLNFFTSDINGDFEIYLEGFTNQGVPVSLRKKILVR